MNRRDLLKGAAVASVAVAVPVATLAKSAPDRRAWDKAMAELNHAKAQSDAFEDLFERIHTAYKAAVDKVPHITMPDGYGGSLISKSQLDVNLARQSCKSLRYVETCAYEGAKANQLFVDALDKRDAKLEQIKRRLRWDEVNERYDALSEAITVKESVLLDMPAPDGEALLWKVNRLYTPGDGLWGDGVEDQTIADLHRFLSRGRA